MSKDMNRPAAVLLLALFSLMTVQAASAKRVSFPSLEAESYTDLAVGGGLCPERLAYELDTQTNSYDLVIQEFESDADNVYVYFNVSAERLEESPGLATVYFRVDKSWMGRENVHEPTVSLNVFTGGWKRLDTRKAGEDEDSMHYVSESPVLLSSFAVTGEPMPVSIVVNVSCNGNGVCEPGVGETSDNCPDCASKGTGKCVPGEKTCMGDYLMTCYPDGSSHSFDICEQGCAGGVCMESSFGIPTGMVTLAGNSLFIALLAALASAAAYLFLSLKRMRSQISSMEGLDRTDITEERRRLMDLKKSVKED